MASIVLEERPNDFLLFLLTLIGETEENGLGMVTS